jgi:hypothetical protein
LWNQPSVVKRRLLRESYWSEARSDEVTPPRNRLATLCASIGSRIDPMLEKPRWPVDTLTSSSL